MRAPNSNRASRTHDTQGSIGATYNPTLRDLLRLLEAAWVSMPSSMGPSISFSNKYEFAHKDLDESLNFGAQPKEVFKKQRGLEHRAIKRMGLCFSLPFWPDEAGNPAIANAGTLQNLAFSGLSFRYPPGLKHPRGEKEPRPDLPGLYNI